ncbi:MAG: zincin-like metallopeptidase domain-containing protein, partial [bacterium]|nr:zincin-like metallopeptidase domain-containing protein [bacterium]
GTRILSFQDKKRIAVTDAKGEPRRDAEGKRVYRYEKLKTPFVRQCTVFNAEQADGLPERPNPTPEPLWKAHQEAERVMEDAGVPVRYVQGDRACYDMNRDEIVLPERGQFPSANHYPHARPAGTPADPGSRAADPRAPAQRRAEPLRHGER